MITHPTLSLLPAAPAPAAPAVDRPRLERAVREMLLAIGEDPTREGLVDTPARVARAWQELFSGLGEQAGVHLARTFVQESEDLVTLSDIEFTSFCEHHLLPFTGVAHIGYIPHGRVVGLSKLARLVEGYARRPQVQERLTSEIADAVMEGIGADGCAVVIEATHACMTIRGIHKPGSKMVTSAMRGGFRRRPETRAEFFAIVRGDRT